METRNGRGCKNTGNHRFLIWSASTESLTFKQNCAVSPQKSPWYLHQPIVVTRSYQCVTAVLSLDVPKNKNKKKETTRAPDLQLQRMLLTLSINLIQTEVGSVEHLYWSCRQEAYRTVTGTCETSRCHNPENRHKAKGKSDIRSVAVLLYPFRSRLLLEGIL